MHANLLAQSDNLSGAELRARGVVVGTIATIRVDEMEKIGKPGQKTKRGVFTFKETGVKPWILNVTNREILKTIFGEGRCGKPDAMANDPDPAKHEHRDGKCFQTDHWIGHRLALGATEQKVSGKTEDGIVIVGCSCLAALMDVTVNLRSKAPRTYTVKPPAKGQPAPQRDGNEVVPPPSAD